MNKEFNKGLFLAGFGSFWWGFFGVLYFKYITYIGHNELVVLTPTPFSAVKSDNKYL